MNNICIRLLVIFAFWLPSLSLANLEFDAKKNNAQLFGPYIKYNALKKPYSFGRFQFKKSDIGIKLSNIGRDDDGKEINGRFLIVQWPKFLLEFGTLKIFAENGDGLLEEDFDTNETTHDDKYVRYQIQDTDVSLINNLNRTFRICLEQEYKESKVTACSDFLRRVNNSFEPTRTSKEDRKASAMLNGQKVPTNAQITIPDQQEVLDINIEFKSGFKIHVVDVVRRLEVENIAIDPVTMSIGIIGGEGRVSSTSLTFKDRFFKFIQEKNYYRNQFEVTQEWPQNLEDAEMEFVPYPLGASAQHYGLILDTIPPPFKFKISEDSPITTYRSVVELKGTKAKNEKLTAKRKNELFINKDEKSFIWKFPAPEKGRMSKNYLALKHKGEYYYFSRRIFRAHRGSVSASAALSTNIVTLDIVPGYVFSADYWPENIWGDKKWSHQKFGFGFNIYETVQSFKPEKDFTEDISINPINFDVMYRFNSGIRPVESSFGFALRYLRYTLFRSINQDLTPGFLGVGGFWHTAPQKIVDDAFNLVPIFRYPKWMELSVFYYPLIIGDFNLGFSWSYHAKGRLYFSRDWYFEATINVMDISFEAVGDTKPRVSTVHGTLGFGWMF